jgi:phosphoenolpyruvate-protein phosphotransferase (PTS system enzyme I)
MPRRDLAGQSAAPGVAVGPLARLTAGNHATRRPGAPAQERAALEQAIAASVAELASLAATSGGEAAEMLEFQIAMLEDEALREPALAAIAGGVAADLAWRVALDAQVADYAAAEDAYFRARAIDLSDLAGRVLRHVLGGGGETVPPGAILLSVDLTPSRFLETDWRHGGGIALTSGSPASHVAMLARARGVPMVVGLGEVPDDGHTRAALDGGAGRLWLSPDAEVLSDIASRADRAARDAVAASALPHRPAVTADGRRIAVTINVAAPSELDGLDPALCDGIGLTRTELLFPASGGLPDEERQYLVYRRVVEWADGRPVTIRTLDAGGDKPIAGLTVAGESNPFLGLRGIRLSLSRPEIFAVQLRALCRAATHGALKIMLPMVTVPDELEAARGLLDDALAALAARGVPARRPALGMMVEVPAAALSVATFDAAFYSIGSNDLTQYVTASARDIGAVSRLADLRNPGVLRLIAEVAAHGKRVGREVSLCGDAAGDPALVAALLDAGIDSLSMAPNAVAAVKAAIARHQQGGTP